MSPDRNDAARGLTSGGWTGTWASICGTLRQQSHRLLDGLPEHASRIAAGAAEFEHHPTGVLGSSECVRNFVPTNRAVARCQVVVEAPAIVVGVDVNEPRSCHVDKLPPVSAKEG